MKTLLVAPFAFLTAACTTVGDSSSTASDDEPATVEHRHPEAVPAAAPVLGVHGKPQPPIDLTYAVMASKPVIGEPMEVEIGVQTPLVGPVTLSYSTKAQLSLADGQVAQAAVGPANGDVPRTDRVRVVMQGPGRGMLVVTARVATDDGLVARLLAVPIQVGAEPRSHKQNGVVKGGGDDAVISLPAHETR